MANTVDKVIKIALNEVGYLEKKSNSQLYDKTANAGYHNYTKYAHEFDTKYPNFYNGKKNNHEWCDVFSDWCFVTAYGVEKAKELLCQPNKSLGAGCRYSMNYYKKNGQFYKTPVVGDQIFFKSGLTITHTGIVYDVDKTYVYTVEGNTSGANGVVSNGGGVCKKKYEISYNKIAGYGRPKYDVVPRNYLMLDDTGKEVKTMQENLIKLGYSCGSTGADGDFGSNTEKAVKEFQKANGLVVDGKYGEKSKAKVEFLLKKAIEDAKKIDSIKEVQNWANKNYKSGVIEDGVYGANTKKALIKILQTELNQTYKTSLVVDGIWGVNTKAACPSLKNGTKNDVVGVLQALLICNGFTSAYLDKDYGSATVFAVKSYQSKTGLVADGIAGKNTFAKLCS